MKSLLLIFAILISPQAQSEEWSCSDSSENVRINITKTKDHGRFQYLEKGHLMLELSLPNQSFSRLNPWASDRDYINFRPGWGESTVAVYGWFSQEEGGLFDIFATGMVARGSKIITTVSNIRCQIIL